MRGHFSLENYKDKIRAGVAAVTDLSKMPEWVVRNTRNPKDDSRSWTFAGHEYQEEIMRDTAHHIVSRKCSQVGFSEFALRLSLGLVNIQKNFTLIYVLPTSAFASSFTKGRIDPVIIASRQLKAASSRDVDSTQMKKFGNSLLYISGSVGRTAGISVPAQGLVIDEKDFCDQGKLSLFHTRLGHAEERELKREFSTPTVDDYGIDKDFSDSSQAFFTVKCRHCYNWVAPNPMVDICIPGFDGDMFKLEREDLFDPRVKVSDAFLRCPHCRNPIDWKQMMARENRQYVHKFPDREVHGYQVYPFDVPSVNTLEKTILTLKNHTKKDWVNMKMGQPYTDAESSFLMSAVDANTEGNCVSLPDIKPEKIIPVMRNTYIGIDMGKTCWVTVLQEQGGRLRTVYLGRVRQTANDQQFKDHIMYICRYFGVACGVMDAMPDISNALWFAGAGDHNQHHWACHYTRSGNKTLENFTVNEEEGIVNAKRTEVFNALAKAVNTGVITFAHSPELETMKEHLKALKRTDQPNEQDEQVQTWVKTGDDHFGHSLNYAYLAYLIAKNVFAGGALLTVAPMFGGAKLAKNDIDTRRPLVKERYPGIDKGV